MTKSQRIRHLERWLRAILNYKPREIVYDEFAYKRLVESYRTSARNALEDSDGE